MTYNLKTSSEFYLCIFVYCFFVVADPWETIYSLSEAQTISKDTLLTTLPFLRTEWKVSFEFKANNFDKIQQVLHMTIGGKGVGNRANYGDRTPAIWADSSKGFLITSAVNGRASYAQWIKPLPPVGEWTTVEVGQELVGRTTIYSITIGGTEVFSGTNSEPAEFEEVKVYACSEWYNPLNGSIRNILIRHKNYGEPVFALKILCETIVTHLFSRFH